MSDQQAVFFDFENIAIWAANNYIDLKLDRILEYLRARGPVVVKRAYADWGLFRQYRDEMLDNSMDLIQMYAVRDHKNRADIRMAIDAQEVAVTRPHVSTFVIVSGDSDFGPLVTRLREYGRYTLGIGPRQITSPLLTRSCDEFVYLETILGSAVTVDEESRPDREAARGLLRRALVTFGQRGDLPVLTAKLKKSMLAMDSSFNEADFGFGQFRTWLESNADIVQLFFRDLQMYAAPVDFIAPGGFGLAPSSLAGPPAEPRVAEATSLEEQYQQILVRRAATADLQIRREVLRDIYRELDQHPGVWTADSLLVELKRRYEAQGLVRGQDVLFRIWQLGFHQRAYDYNGQTASFRVPVRLAQDINSEVEFILRAESGLIHAVIQAGLPVQRALLASVFLNDSDQVEQVDALLADLQARGLIVGAGEQSRIPDHQTIPFRDDLALQPILRDVQQARLAEGQATGVDAARALAETARIQRSRDFAASAQSYLAACRLLWDAVRSRDTAASLDELRRYMASYASVKAGELSQVHRNYVVARLYYLAFFWLVQEDDPLWDQMRGLISPMLSFYWSNIVREAGLTFAPGATPAQIAVQIAKSENSAVRRQWEQDTEALAKVNPRLLQRIVSQIRLVRPETTENLETAKEIEDLLLKQGAIQSIE